MILAGVLLRSDITQVSCHWGQTTRWLIVCYTELELEMMCFGMLDAPSLLQRPACVHSKPRSVVRELQTIRPVPAEGCTARSFLPTGSLAPRWGCGPAYCLRLRLGY